VTMHRDIEGTLDLWLEEGPERIPDRVIDAAIEVIDHTGQRRRLLRLPRRHIMRPKLEIAAILIGLIAIVSVGSGLIGGRQQGIIALPSTTPSTAPDVVRPSSSAEPVMSDLIVLEHFGGRLDDGDERPDENSTSRLWVFDPSGSPYEAVELLPDRTGSQAEPAWSPDGTLLAFTGMSGPDEPSELEQVYLTTALGQDPTMLAVECESTCAHAQASFSPDGTKVVVRRVVFGAGPDEAPTTDMLAIVDIASGQVRELLSTALDPDARVWNQSPRWSPDGEQIVFHRPTFGPDGSLTASSLFVVDIDGSGLTELLTVPFAGDAEWSPDGSTIAFSTYPRRVDQAVGERLTGYDIYTVRPDGGELDRLTTDGVSSAPAWTPDGRLVYISSPLVGATLATDIFLMAADGSDQRMLTSFVYRRGQCCTFYAQVQPSR
jgi:Tol biopolymer transport system component